MRPGVRLTAHLGLTRWARTGLALLTVLAPALITEVSGNAANLHWPPLPAWSRITGGSWRTRWPGESPAHCSQGVVAACVLSADGHGDTLRSNGPGWRQTVVAAQNAGRSAAVTSVDVTVAPGGDHWMLRIPCRRLLADED